MTGKRSQRGIALVAALFALSIVTLIGLTLTFTGATQTLINWNNRLRLLNLYASEAATEEARDRVKELLGSGLLSLSDPSRVVYIVTDPSINPSGGDADSNPHFDPEYSTSLSASLVPSNLGQIKFSWVKIILKNEERAGYDLDGLTSNSDVSVYHGYSKLQPDAKLSQYVNSDNKPATYTGVPVFLVTALSSDDAGYKQWVRTEISAVAAPPLSAVLFSSDAISVADDLVQIVGEDESGVSGSDLNGLESKGDITGNMANVSGTPLPARPFSSYSYSMDDLIKSLKPPSSREIEKVAPSISKLADGTYVGDGLNLGQVPTAGDLPQATFADGPLNISNSAGQGILVVNGDLSVSGTFLYYGLILVRGKLLFTGGSLPGIEIHGAIIASSVQGDQTSLLSGNVKIINNSFVIQKQFNALGYVRLSFRELS